MIWMGALFTMKTNWLEGQARCGGEWILTQLTAGRLLGFCRGSVLEPALLNVFIKDLTKGFKCSLSQFAIDT